MAARFEHLTYGTPYDAAWIDYDDVQASNLDQRASPR